MAMPAAVSEAGIRGQTRTTRDCEASGSSKSSTKTSSLSCSIRQIARFSCRASRDSSGLAARIRTDWSSVRRARSKTFEPRE